MLLVEEAGLDEHVVLDKQRGVTDLHCLEISSSLMFFFNIRPELGEHRKKVPTENSRA